jgi:hypothetical protein
MVSYMSIIDQRLTDLTRRIDEISLYTDLILSGPKYDEDTNEIIITVTKNEALKNAVRMWFLSKMGDYERDPTRGGVLDMLLGRQLTDENAVALSSSIAAKFKIEFPYVVLGELIISVNYKINSWRAYMTLADLVSKQIIDLSINVQV